MLDDKEECKGYAFVDFEEDVSTFKSEAHCQSLISLLFFRLRHRRVLRSITSS